MQISIAIIVGCTRATPSAHSTNVASSGGAAARVKALTADTSP